MSEFPLEAEKAIDGFNELIDKMKQSGWEEVCVIGDTYVITNSRVTDQQFDSWLEAIGSCIEVASDV